jgi:hypothetical protein
MGNKVSSDKKKYKAGIGNSKDSDLQKKKINDQKAPSKRKKKIDRSQIGQPKNFVV